MEIDDATIETLAKAIHESYLADQGTDGPQWDDLSEDLREANRAQARAIAGKLASIGARVEAGATTEPFAFTPAEVERLAKGEHRRLMAQRRRAGWIYAPVRDAGRKHHPMMIAWDELPEPERDKDRNAVIHIPHVLARAGMHIVRQLADA
jgi:hypothetical protein